MLPASGGELKPPPVEISELRQSAGLYTKDILEIVLSNLLLSTNFYILYLATMSEEKAREAAGGKNEEKQALTAVRNTQICSLSGLCSGSGCAKIESGNGSQDLDRDVDLSKFLTSR